LLGLALAFLAVTVASAQADPTYGTINAEGGIYWRSGPDWNTAEAIGGFGFYPDTIIEVHCYQSGAGDVPGSTDSMWEEASDVGGSGYGSGWINEHFINDGQPINQPSPGVSPCGAAPAPAPTPSPAPAPTPTGGLVFTVFNAEGGIYYRYGPHWSETTQTPGVGVYDGDQVELICGAFGDAVGPYAARSAKAGSTSTSSMTALPTMDSSPASRSVNRAARGDQAAGAPPEADRPRRPPTLLPRSSTRPTAIPRVSRYRRSRRPTSPRRSGVPGTPAPTARCSR
jgi:hypothetical protein